jgi:serine/threonine protein kinase
VGTSESRLAAVFAAALQAAPEDRARVIAEQCEGDLALEATVHELVAASERAGSTGGLARAVGAALPTPLAPGTTIGPYVIERVVATGGMGIVYRARDTALDVAVALKAVKPAIARDERARRTLRDEARTAARLSDHPNIAPVYAFLEQDGEAFIVSRFVEGETLRAQLARGPLAVRDGISVALDILEALGAAHAAGIVHRDLKPENVMRTPDGRIIVLDFGIAVRDVESPDRTTTEITAAGTAGYMSPEQIRNQPLDGRSDLFALGIVLYELLTGQHPFGASGTASAYAAVLSAATRPLTESERARLPRGLESVLETALARRADDRYSSAGAMATALRAIRDGAPDSAAPRAIPPVEGDAVSWWRTHELWASGIYWLLLAPAWAVHKWIPVVDGRVIILVLLTTLAVVPTLRLHLWFIAGVTPRRAAEYLARYRPWLAVGDAVFALSLVAIGVLLSGSHTGWALLFVGFGLGSAVVAAFVEPRTAEEALDALDPRRSDSRN